MSNFLNKKNFTYMDLTHGLTTTISVYPGKTCLTRTVKAHYENGYQIDDIALSTGIGTHMDAPSHFYQGAATIDQIDTTKLIAHGCVMDISAKVGNNQDYFISDQDILEWENEHGKILEECIFLAYTGWSRRWCTPHYCKMDEKGVCHFPGFAASAALLLKERKVNGVGIDTMGIDPGCNIQFDAHKILLKENIILLENLTSLEQLPATGTSIMAFPMKIVGSPEAPCRVVAGIDSELINKRISAII